MSMSCHRCLLTSGFSWRQILSDSLGCSFLMLVICTYIGYVYADDNSLCLSFLSSF